MEELNKEVETQNEFIEESTKAKDGLVAELEALK